jgi:hypothetical protein
MKYAQATAAFGQVAGIRCSPDLARQASDLASKAESFRRVGKKYVKVRADAGKQTRIVVLDGGRELKGVVTRKRDGSYTVLKGTSGGGQMAYTFKAHEIKKIKDVDPAERIAELRGEVTQKVDRLGSSPEPAQLVDVAVYALENGLRQDGHKLLGRAWDVARGTDGKSLLQLYAEHRAGRLYAAADWYDSVSQEISARQYCRWILEDPEYKTTHWGSAARKLLAMMDQRKGIKNYQVTYKVETPKVKLQDPKRLTPLDPTPASRKPARITTSRISSKGQDLSEADKLFGEGLKHYFKGRPGRPNFNHHLSEASRRFRKAVQIYERALQSDRGNSSLRSRIQDCNMKLHSCMKMSTL